MHCRFVFRRAKDKPGGQAQCNSRKNQGKTANNESHEFHIIDQNAKKELANRSVRQFFRKSSLPLDDNRNNVIQHISFEFRRQVNSR